MGGNQVTGLNSSKTALGEIAGFIAREVYPSDDVAKQQSLSGL
jgi:hypothetical protein